MEKSSKLMRIFDKELSYGAGRGEAKAIAFAAATARTYAPGEIQELQIHASPLFIIGVQTNLIPNAGQGKRGGMLAAALGALGGNPALGLDALAAVTDPDIIQAAERLAASGRIALSMTLTAPDVFLRLTLRTASDKVTVLMQDSYTGIKYIEHNGAPVLDRRLEQWQNPRETMDWSGESIDTIFDYCTGCDLAELEEFKRVIEVTRAVVRDGLDHPYGLQVGRTLLEQMQTGFVAGDEFTYIIAHTVAGIDARMNGSPCPTVGTAGSGSQGHIVGAAPIAAGEYLHAGEEQILRAVALAHLLNLYLDFKSREYSHCSPMCYCGSVAPAVGVAAVAYLHGFSREQITDLMRTVLGTFPGLLCDGASKPVCAMRAYVGMCGALHAMLLAEKGLAIQSCEGYAADTVEGTIENLYRLQRECLADANGLLYQLKKEQGTLC